MAEDVKGFIVYRKFYMGISLLSCEQKGKLLEALFADMGEGEMPNLDPVTQAVFSMMLPSVHDAQSSFSRRSEASRENGKLGGRPKKEQVNTETIEITGEKNKPNEKPKNLKNLQVSENLNRIDKNRIEKINTPHTPQGDSVSKEEYSDEFEIFWREYPNKNSGKKKAYSSFKTAMKKTTLAELMRSLDAHKRSSQWTKDDGKFIPHATTWLNGERWTVELEPEYKPSDRWRGAI